MRAVAPVLLASCAAELPWQPTSICDEIRFALSARVLECTDDPAAAAAVSDALEADVPCAITGALARGASLQPVVTTDLGTEVDIAVAYACADVARALPCGPADARALWASVVAADPRCAPLRESSARSTLPECESFGDLKLCVDPRPWPDAVEACASANLSLWDADPVAIPEEVFDVVGETWLGLSMQRCEDPVACAEMWTWLDGSLLSGPSARPWAAGEPDPTSIGTAVMLTREATPSGYGSVENWYATPPSEPHGFVCRPD